MEGLFTSGTTDLHDTWDQIYLHILVDQLFARLRHEGHEGLLAEGAQLVVLHVDVVEGLVQVQ